MKNQQSKVFGKFKISVCDFSFFFSFDIFLPEPFCLYVVVFVINRKEIRQEFNFLFAGKLIAIVKKSHYSTPSSLVLTDKRLLTWDWIHLYSVHKSLRYRFVHLSRCICVNACDL